MKKVLTNWRFWVALPYIIILWFFAIPLILLRLIGYFGEDISRLSYNASEWLDIWMTKVFRIRSLAEWVAKTYDYKPKAGEE